MWSLVVTDKSLVSGAEPNRLDRSAWGEHGESKGLIWEAALCQTSPQNTKIRRRRHQEATLQCVSTEAETVHKQGGSFKSVHVCVCVCVYISSEYSPITFKAAIMQRAALDQQVERVACRVTAWCVQVS